jgi:SAM-dependent methyltransferase
MSGARESYAHGHHESVLRSHRWRTAANSAAYLLDWLVAGADVLDVGCGPGTITIDFARRVAPGRVVGVDRSEVVDAARREAEGVANVEFCVGDVYRLPAADATFDVVHAHQLLQHLCDPIAALVEMRRVCRPTGVVAARDSDYAAAVWYPADPALDRWLDLQRWVIRDSGGDPDAGRRLLGWARRAGFSEVVPSASVWCFATPEGGQGCGPIGLSARCSPSMRWGVGWRRGLILRGWPGLGVGGRPRPTAGSSWSTVR